MLRLHHFVLLPLLASPALAQLPAPTLIPRVAPRAAWTAITSAGTSSTTVHQRADSPGAASSDKLYVFGGSKGNNTTTTLNDLWVFDPLAGSGTFTQLIANGAPGSPAARGRASIAWNFTTSRLTVFGGNTRGTTPTLLGDVWEWDAVNGWFDVTPTSGPAPVARQYAALTWDPVNNGMVLFGGQTNDVVPASYSSETWVFTANATAGTPGTWTDLTSGIVTLPPARAQHSLMTRPDVGDCILCGGLDNTSATPDQIRFLDVWTWNGTTWSKISDCDVTTNPTGAGTTWPANVSGNQAVYDARRKRIVMQGGQGITVAANTVYVYGPSYGGSPSNYTSEFDCLTNTWSIYANAATGATPYNNNDPQIGRISRFYAGYIAATGKVYKACGQNAAGSSSNPTYNVYQYQANPVASTMPYGTGCTGPGGVLSLVADNDPWTTRTFQCTGTGFGPSSLGISIVGLTQVLPGVLPVNTLPVPGGGAGCDLLATLDIIDTLLPIAGQATYYLPIGDALLDPSLPGLPFFVQFAELEFTPFPAWTGTYSTNGLSCVVGSL